VASFENRKPVTAEKRNKDEDKSYSPALIVGWN